LLYINNVNFSVLKQNYYALVGVIKDWMSQNARYNCEKKTPVCIHIGIIGPRTETRRS